MSLSRYVEKRDFKQTSEPKGGKAKGKKLVFVVQRHHASHLHYDFRLEIDGMLKSWAVPKGPSLNPNDKRLAMMVEDHPYDYRKFEGTIPKGNYGAGVVTIFDEGTYQALSGGVENLKKGIAEGNLKFVLHGKKLKGEFALVRMKGTEHNAWLLIKHKDRYAVNVAYNVEDMVAAKIKKEGKDFKKEKISIRQPKIKEKPTVYQKPMLAKLTKDAFNDEEWIFEEKLDGYRAIAQLEKHKVMLFSRNGKNIGTTYPPLLTALQKLDIHAILDGEIVIRNSKGRSVFQSLQHYDSHHTHAKLAYVIFDVLQINGSDVRMMPLHQRKRLLEMLLKHLPQESIEVISFVKKNGEAFFDEAKTRGWEGIIAKKLDSPYLSNTRSENWLKIKLQQTQEAVIMGYTKPNGERKHFGALVLAIRKAQGWVYIGNCGTGFNQKTLKEIHEILIPLQTDHKSVIGKVVQETKVTWVKPQIVCEVTFTEWTADQHLRHPVFKGIRTDKKAGEMKKEIGMKIRKQQVKEENEREVRFGRKKLKLTNQDKIYWPDEHITKGQLIAYYQNIAKFILPHLKNRPLSLNRHPNGIKKPNFFQKDLNTDQIPNWIKYASLRSSHLEKKIDYLICNNEATLFWMVNLGCIEINPWISTYQKPEQPLFAVLDLDPLEIDFGQVVKVALTAKSLLDQMKLKAFVKTSGSKGIHIVIPLAPIYSYDITRNFIHYLAGLIYEQHPDITSLERSPTKRKGKIYLDYLQNSIGQTIVAPYSARPKSGATVSTPLQWEELTDDLQIKNFTIFNTYERVRELGDLWKDMYRIKNKLVEVKIKK